MALKNTDMLCAKMEEFVLFFLNGGEKAKFHEYLSLYLKDNCSDGKVNVKNEINISYLVSRLYSMYPKILRRKRPFGILEE